MQRPGGAKIFYSLFVKKFFLSQKTAMIHKTRLFDRTPAQDVLKKINARVTQPRVRVLTLLLNAEHALSHTDIISLMAATGDEPLDRVTIYRVLEWLLEQQLVHRIAGADRVWRFAWAGVLAAEQEWVDDQTLHEVASKGRVAKKAHAKQSPETSMGHTHAHAHFQCEDCLQVHCLPLLDVSNALPIVAKAGSHKVRLHTVSSITPFLPQGFQGYSVQLTVQGLCADCLPTAR